MPREADPPPQKMHHSPAWFIECPFRPWVTAPVASKPIPLNRCNNNTCRRIAWRVIREEKTHKYNTLSPKSYWEIYDWCDMAQGVYFGCEYDAREHIGERQWQAILRIRFPLNWFSLASLVVSESECRARPCRVDLFCGDKLRKLLLLATLVTLF